MKAKKLFVLITALALCMAGAAGCASGAAPETAPSSAVAATSGTPAVAEAEGTAAAAGGVTYPIPGNHTLTYFGALHKNVSTQTSSYADLPITQLWFEKTGVTLEFNTPAAGMEEEQLNILLAAADYPDIMSYSWLKYPGGLSKLSKDGVIIELSDMMNQNMPNLMKYLGEHPDVDRQVKNDDGQYFSIPFLKQGRALLSTNGPNLRSDILAEIGMESPDTVAEWEAVFEAVKAAHPDMAPMVGDYTLIRRFFQPAFGVSEADWYVDKEGVVRYSPLEEGYREFITLMADWYSRGLIDQNFSTYDETAVNNVMSSGMGFATYGSSLDKYNAANADNGDFLVVAERTPGYEEEERVTYVAAYEFGSNAFAVISSKCENVDVAMQMYDWAFGEEGYRTLNWGVEGESYTIGEDGLPYYTDLILKNPDGLSVAESLAWNIMAGIKGPAMLAQDERYMIQYYSDPIQVEALEKWGDKDYEFRSFPPVSYTDEETSAFVSATADINTYVESMAIKFIIGAEPLDNWDNFTSTLTGMGIDGAKSIQQAAVDRYNAR